MNKYNNELYDHGPNPIAIDIDRATKTNKNFRTALWTGDNLQVTLMNINPGEDIGMEIHPLVDQFIRVESGYGFVKMGKEKNDLSYRKNLNSDYAVIVPAGTWHNIINVGNIPLKIYTIYSPVQHPFGTVQETKDIAEKSKKYY